MKSLIFGILLLGMAQLQAAETHCMAYQLWSGGAAFNEDSNGDGLANGVAWLLGAADKDADASHLAPNFERRGDSLQISFICLKKAFRGGTALKVQVIDQQSNEDTWVTHEAEVTDTASSENGISFETRPHKKHFLIHVKAVITGITVDEPFARLVAILP